MSTPLHAATNPGFSAWVSANAGAGKTYLLTDRVTRLLLSGAKPSRILCLTYTKAAAAEMATRLFNRLGEWALLPDTDLTARLIAIGAGSPDARTLRKARTLFAQALETPGGLKIQTIHSFCQNVLARFPVEAGIPARFTVLDERSTAELMAQARNAVLQQAANGDVRLSRAVATLATRAADGRFAEILNFAVGDGGRLRDLLAQHAGDETQFFAHLRNTLGIAEGEDEAQILARFCAELGGERALCDRIAKWLLGGSRRDIERGKRLALFVDDLTPDSFEQLRGALLKQDGEPNAPIATKACLAAEPDLAIAADDLQRRLVAVEERRKCARTVALTEALVTVATTVLAKFDALKRERAALDYDDLIRTTLMLLDRRDAASWVLFKLDGGLDHILVDEAQDTSPEQWKIVGKLADEFFAGLGRREDAPPRTLFAVGDEKQSIFSFQGADPAQFSHYRNVFKGRAEGAGLPFADLRPAVSRRSARTVLEFVDALFAAADARDGLTASDDPIHHDPYRAETGRVEIWPLVKAPANEEREFWDLPVDAVARNDSQIVLAARLAARIAGWMRDGVTLPNGAPITPGDIMILVRRRNAFAEEVIRQLLEKGVPVAGADRMILLEQIAISDLVALGHFALLPDDDLNLASLLKSPLVDLSEAQLYDLAHGRKGGLWDAFSARKDECAAFQIAHAFLTDILAKADFLPPFEFYARVLGKTMRSRLVARLGPEAADAIDEFLALALAHESAHPPSLEGFLHWFAAGASDVKRDMEQAGGAVRVMTVHGAKGLEANVVILPDTAQVPDHERREPLLYTEDCVFYGVPKPLETPITTAAKAAAQLREMREYRRLLYVAATRAREFLVVCGYENKIPGQAAHWYRHLGEAGKRIGREEDIDGERVIAIGAALTSGAVPPAMTQRKLTILPEFFARPAIPKPPSRVLRPSEAAGLEEPVLVSPLADGGKRFQRGLFVHALLARLPEMPPEKREAAALAYLRRQGVEAEAAAGLVAETMAILNHPIFAPLFAPNSRAEIAVTAELPELGNVRVNGQIDRLAVTEDAVLIADFKTNRPPPAHVTDTSKLYLSQMALYRAALRKIYPGKRIDCALVWTDGARLMPLPAALLDAEIARIAGG
ncbi:MAG TPA: double-strand break repair helicase AddA [Micropepsaceae bacterium]|jgi:ATP-dependent helicase/nuclease subunit A|nr:double-strand break repair helicase AddA [Micropepsaceae bacterium]